MTLKIIKKMTGTKFSVENILLYNLTAIIRTKNVVVVGLIRFA